MGVPVQVVLDVPLDIAAGLASGTLVRVGGVVRNAKTGTIVKHLGEGRLPAKEAANGVPKVAQRVLSTTRGKIGAGILVCGAVAAGGTFAVGWWINRRRTKELNAALEAYLDAAKAGEMSVEQIDALSSAIEAARGGDSRASALIAEKVVDLVEGYTVALAQANETIWEPERGADVVPLVRLERSLNAQRCILGTAA
ncbi:hypothetical protein [Actinomyces viscosus]|uniref:hypothetical protein n=1 Tax=Actinomyces viscosus TaxID=1656 RepID=UPI0028EA41B6|nr:hypothetical protein [Actinomyces viscosus]